MAIGKAGARGGTGSLGVLGRASGGGATAALQFVTTGGELPSNLGTLSTTLGSTTRFAGYERIQVGYGGAKALRLILPTFAWASGEQKLTNPIPVKCAFYFPDAPGTKLVRVAWGGNTTGSIPANATSAEYVADDVLPSSFGYGSAFPANEVGYFKFEYDCAVGVQNFSGVGRDVIDTDSGCWYGNAASYTSQIDTAAKTNSSGATGNGNSANPPAWTLRPWAIVGVPAIPTISPLILGDSIFQGQLGVAYPNLSTGGYLSNGLMDVNGHCIPWASNARFGTTAAGYNADANFMKATYKYATHALLNYGSNAGVAATELAALQALWANLKAATGSTITRVEQALILPRDTTTDSYATLANQTYSNSAIRDTLNPAIISNVGSNGLDDYLDIQGVFASPSSPWTGAANKWPVTGTANAPTTDGTHPSDYLARSQMAPVVTTRAISWLQAKVTAAPVNVTLPVILGVRNQGATLVVTKGTWQLGSTAYNTLSYQWKSNGTTIVGATSSSYVLQAGDVGTTITCDVTAINGIGSTTATSAATATILATAPTPPSFPASGVILSSLSIVSGASFANVGQAGSQTDPLGGTTANKITYSTTANNQKVVNYAAATVTRGQRVTASLWAKAVEYQYFYLSSADGLTGHTYIFDALNCTIVSGNLNGSPPNVPEQVSIVAEPNGWVRANITYTPLNTATGGTGLWFGIMATNSGNINLPGAGTVGSGLLFWRAQLATGGVDS